jgi:uncharacterized protein YwgA
VKEMPRSKYNIINILCSLKEMKIRPGKKQFQKLVYLIENVACVDLGFTYNIHYYGPYSTELDDTLTKLGGDGLFHYDYSGLSHLINIDDLGKDDDFVEYDLQNDEIEAIGKVLEKFGHKSPSELELITTTHFVKSNLTSKDEESVLRGVKKIKGNKYSDAQIKGAMELLTT